MLLKRIQKPEGSKKLSKSIVVTVKSEGATRPSEHKLNPAFTGGINYKETFTCANARKHADLFMKILDLTAVQCGIETKEFKPDPYFISEMNATVTRIESLHAYVKKLKT